MKLDATRSQALLVTLPEETPVNELVETAYSLEDTVGVALGPVVVNGVVPDLVGLDVPPVEAAGDEPTADLLTQRMHIHEKTAWMLRSLLA